MSKNCIVAIARKYLPEPVKDFAQNALFFGRKYTRGFDIAEEPFLDSAGKARFAEALSHSRGYLEYGSGGSTVMAAGWTEIMASVESDRRFLVAVSEKVAHLPRHPVLAEFIHADIGLTKRWGYPVMTRPTEKRLAAWQGYAEAPWRFFEAQGVTPDTVLIDGRFRVACALTSLANLAGNKSAALLFDDYTMRPHYRPVEEFGELQAVHGRMAVFRPRPGLNVARCREAAAAFRADCR